MDLALPKNRSFSYRTPLFIVRLTRYEYWPVWILFFPAFLYYLFLAVKARSLTYFTAANPGIELGGFFGESKSAILERIPGKYLPGTLFFKGQTAAPVISAAMKASNIQYPIICKPDKGERGYMVEKINDEATLGNYLSQFKGNLIIQEFVDFPLELGILYYRFPDGSGSGISSVTLKEFLSVEGNGIATVEQLMMNSDRARLQLSAMRKRAGTRLNQVLGPGEKLLLEPIGNHCRGTRFLNGAELINEQLVKVIDTISSGIDGFYFERFDLKVGNLNSLYTGEGIKILEVNGTTSEPAHIYDPGMNLWKAWLSILYHTGLVYTIARQNHRLGVPYNPVSEVMQTVVSHFKSKSSHDI